MNILKRREIKKAIDEAWNNREGKELRDKLFPNGKPEPEEFVRGISQAIKDNTLTH